MGLQKAMWAKRVTHGGEVRVGKRKCERPIATKQAMHVTMKAEAATGRWSFLRKENRRIIEALIVTLGRRWSVKVYEQGFEGNHLHLLVKAETRQGFSNFFRALAAQIATRITGARKGKPLGHRFWTRLFWSRIVTWGRAFRIAKRYVLTNQLEGLGILPRRTLSLSTS